jgi:retron-type reverse transcriptase
MKWENLYSESVLLKAVLKLYEKSLFYRSKSYNTWIDDETLFDFVVDSKKRLNQLHAKLADGTFEFSPIKMKHVKFWQKERLLHIECWEDKIVNTMLFTMLNEIYSSHQSPYSYAYKHKSGGVDACQRAIIKYTRRHNCKYFIKRDIQSYFPSVDHKILLEKLDIEDEYLKKLVVQRIKFEYYPHEEEYLVENTVGIPFGTPIACFFANLFLTDLDRDFEKLSVGYFRYADDFLIASPTREGALEAMELLDSKITELKLVAKESHSHQYTFNESDDVFEKVLGFKHLGLFYRSDYEIGMSSDKLHKIRNLFLKRFKKGKRKLAKLDSIEKKAQFLVNLSNDALQYIKPAAVIDYYLKHVTDETQLSDLDRWLAEEVLARATGNGHKKGNFRHISFKKLRDMGLPSLRHRRRLVLHGHIDSNFFKLRNAKLTERFKKTKGPRSPHPKKEKKTCPQAPVGSSPE